MVAQLAIFANFSVPFGGLVGAALIYALRKDSDPIARENYRRALNFEATLAIVNTLMFIAYAGIFFIGFLSTVAAGHTSRHIDAHTGIPPAFAVPFGIMAVLSLVGFAAIVASCVAARAAWLGRLVSYPLSIPFVK